ncbi:Gti1/Pac2 family-domain-containing protein [Aspergillus cavernicola]|uniref:Gti1/Pac2 family-domain-containing protein n=1 Tax=Aspergillus cavernicola TaxID=176166 RepID=A0ABR4INB0_9EURO
MVNSTSTVLEPTYVGYVQTTKDALLLFEACLAGVLHHVPRRPHDRERSHLVRSGSVFIYEENSSGIKRWTDGVPWSPSRILGNFLVYRELEKPFPPGEKKRAMKKTPRRPGPPGRPGEPYPRHESNGSYSPAPVPTNSGFGERPHQTDLERALVGSLVDSYGFKESGLVKKTMSVTVSGVTHHLVSYYSVEDVARGDLLPPSTVETLKYLRPRHELTHKQSFRAPIDELDHIAMDNTHDLYPYPSHLMTAPPYPMQNQHPEYFVHPNTYATVTHPSQSNPIAGFPLGAPIPSQQPAYLPAPTAPPQMPQMPQPQKHDDYHHFRGQTHSYGSTFDPLGHSSLSTIQPGIPPLPSSIAERARSQSDQSHQSAYRNSSISSRSAGTDVTSPMDPPTPATYSQRGSFGLAGQVEGTAHPPLEHRGLSFDASIPRRESHPVSAQYYPSERHPYYMNAPPPPTHPNYPVPTWSPTSAQPQI